MRKKSKRRDSRIWRFVKRLFLILFISQLLYIILLRWVNPPITVTQLGSMLAGDGLKRDYISGEEIPSHMKLAVIASEDQIFPDHSGFDWKSIDKAMKYNKKKPNRIRGASTISQQVAKNVFLWQGRSWIRKGLEIYFTKMIEWIWGKRRIMEVYLNVIEMGKGIYGVEATAQHYFKKSASRLSRKEASLIAACLPAPKRFIPQPPSFYVGRKSAWIQGQMRYLETDPDVQAIIAKTSIEKPHPKSKQPAETAPKQPRK